MFRKWGGMILLLLLACGCTALQPTPPPVGRPTPSDDPLVGTYRVTGTNPDGSSYRGTLTIEAQGETYSLIWEVGNTLTTGVGLRQGDVLSGGWDCGVVTYQIQGDGSLEGVWALCGERHIGTERAVPTRPGVQG